MNYINCKVNIQKVQSFVQISDGSLKAKILSLLNFLAKFLTVFKSFILLGVYDSWSKLVTMGVSSRTIAISVIYEKGDKKDIANYKPVSFLNLAYKTYTKILKKRMHKTSRYNNRWKTISCYHKKNYIIHTSIIRDSNNLSSTLNKPHAVISVDFLKAFDKMD